ncbi:glycosyltransferase involved in cell wall biosynthesis [Mucilaginibacter gracilis]|uniref:Glycosyltransferase involved in cell wall biosynthesis n=1 Tax=Mucilaginibacter gracilis TaxID=423350 RepID=A0A495JAD4_9SPHI|nr:glycosyltransferase family 1 protein [Mucilaginibacter gracilis]RKR85671.1 glycosyltransferase involved in cell wall biosynthesis [Mucilaginibacter gracilis]
MIKVQFDHQTFSMHKFGGISRYFASIQESLSKEPDFTFDRGILYTTNHYLKDQSFPLPKLIGDLFLQKERRRSKWNKRYAKLKIKKNDFDVFHPTYYNPYFLRKLNGPPIVLTVHDMIHELFPEYFPHFDDTIYLKRLLIEKADHFIAVSQNTADDLQRLFNIPDEKITVIHHGFFPAETDSNYIPPYQNYILYVGERGGYKNFYRFLEAVADVLISNNLNLVCAGSKSFCKAEEETMRRLNIAHLVTHVAPTDGELNQLYSKAKLFVYPSLYEGFGLPILEAFNNTCPVAISNTSCFEEVGGNAAAYFDPYDVRSIKETMNMVLLTPGKADELRAAGAQQLQKFSLKLCMEKTIGVYRKLAAKAG